jgi:hypothetical protein
MVTDNHPLLQGSDLYLTYAGSDVPALNGISFTL